MVTSSCKDIIKVHKVLFIFYECFNVGASQSTKHKCRKKYLQVLTKEFSVPNTSGTFDLLCLKNVSDRQKETSDNHRAIMS